MKTRKLITGILVFAFLSIALAFLNTSKAAISNLGYVKITPDRTATVKYKVTNPDTGEEVEREYTAKYAHQFGLDKASTKNVWNLVTCRSATDKTETNTAQDLYCLRAGLGFTQDLGGTNYNPDPVLYNQEYNMIKEYETVKNYLANLHSETTIFNNKANFNSVMWILDNMLLEGASEQEYIDYLIKYAGYNNNTGAGITGTSLNLATMKENVLTRADIAAIQQMAIWYFTNSDEVAYHSETIKPIYLDIEGGIYDTNGQYKLFSDIYNTTESYGTFRQQAAAQLYLKLITDAKKAPATTSNGLYNPKREIIVYLGEDAAREQPIVQVKEKNPEADIALRKYISAINGVELVGDAVRAPKVDTRNLNKVINNNLQTTAIYNHPKKPLSVKIGDVVTYTIRVYNEGDIDTYIKEITDYLPSYIEYIPYGEDIGGYWLQDENGATATTTPYCKITGAGGELKYSELRGKTLGEILIPAAKYNEAKKDTAEAYTLSYVDIQISGRVMKTAPYETAITNIAQVTEIKDENNQTVKDRDSVSSKDSAINGFVEPTEVQKPTYSDNKMPTDTTKPYYVPGQEDDDDFDKVIIEKPIIDLALRKFISAIGDVKYDRAPRVNTSGLRAGSATTAIYNHSKEPIKTQIGDIVTYTLRIYNEGEVDGKAVEITDYIAKNLKYVPFGRDLNADWWIETQGKEYNTVVTTDKCLVTNVGGKTNKACIGEKLKDVIIPAYDKKTDTLSYIDIEIHCQIQKVAESIKLTNIAEITEERDEYDRPVDKDKDSTPGNVKVPNDKDLPNYKDEEIEKPYVPGQQDDDDFEKVLVVVPEVDLSLRKYISAVDGKKLEGKDSREPIVKTGPLDTYNGTTAEYDHTKTPITVKRGSLITYTIRVYNEGEIDAYVSEITDYLPNNLIYQPDNEINKKYGWKYDSQTRQVVTTITAEENEAGDEVYKDRETGKLIRSYKGTQILDYIDVEIVCKVDEKALGNDILTNLAQITEMTDKDGNEIEEDRDSRPDDNFKLPDDKNRPTYKDDEEEKTYIPGQEDDDDFEKVKVEPIFDLSLLKWVAKTKITQDGQTVIKDTGHTVETAKGEAPYKVPELTVKDIKTVNIKFIYTIRVTNEGEIPGYATEVKDYIPEGLEFKQEDNPDWKKVEGEKNIVVTDKLKNTLLKEKGGYAEVEIVLTWINGEKNLGEKINLAEISQDKNDYDIPDIDSTPDNKKPGEDDIDEAPVILSVKTGSTPMYLGLTTVLLAIFVGGIYLIKKYVLE